MNEVNVVRNNEKYDKAIVRIDRFKMMRDEIDQNK